MRSIRWLSQACDCGSRGSRRRCHVRRTVRPMRTLMRQSQVMPYMSVSVMFLSMRPSGPVSVPPQGTWARAEKPVRLMKKSLLKANCR